ncbi:hypothetical protein JCM10908_004488 [Rhodotorula pacifica]|uniref:uncharacterized protein n=1 Tax=Rhodotorula pacifica TaxID=1495444 RepID=UPI003173D3F6
MRIRIRIRITPLVMFADPLPLAGAGAGGAPSLDYVDALPLLQSALHDLPRAQIVRDERYPMMELMSAIEINDARTDTYLYAQKQREQAVANSSDGGDGGRAEDFDPAQIPAYSAAQVLEISRELLRLEATFHAGHSLASTLWGCNLLRPSSLAALSTSISIVGERDVRETSTISGSGSSPLAAAESSSGASSPASTTAPAPTSASTSKAEAEAEPTTRPAAQSALPAVPAVVVLRALLLGTVKCAEIVWEELSKGQVYEHEDVHLSLSTLSFNTLLSAAAAYPRADPPPPTPTFSSAAPSASTAASPLLLPGQELAQPAPPTWQEGGQPSVQAGEGEERRISTDEVLQALDEALSALDADTGFEGNGIGEGAAEEEGEQVAKKELRAMVLFRISLLYVLALFTAPTRTNPPDVSMHLSHLRSSLSALASPSSAPSLSHDLAPRVRAVFTPSRSIPLLSTQQPPRPVVPLAFSSAIEQTRVMCTQMEELVLLWREWDADADEQEDDGGEASRWRRFEEWAKGRGREGSETVPYVRSLQQSLIVPSPTSPLFGASPLLSLTSSFLLSSVPLSSSSCTLIPSLLHALSFLRLRQPYATSPAHQVLHFLEQDLTREFLLRNTVHLSGQNRARQRRWTIKMLSSGAGGGGNAAMARLPREGIEEGFRPAWEACLPALLQEARDSDAEEEEDSALLGPLTATQRAQLAQFPNLLASAIRRQSALWALEAHLSAFEPSMGLFEATEEEKRQAWWVAERVAKSVEEEIRSSLRDAEEKSLAGMALRRQADEVHAIAVLCQSSRWLSLTTTAAPIKFSSPFLPELAVPSRDAARGRFRQHFEWLNVLRNQDTEREVVSFEAYEAQRQPTVRALQQVAKTHLEALDCDHPPPALHPRAKPSSGPHSWFALAS